MANLSIEVACSQCGSKHHVNTRLAGRSVRCPHCDASVVVPAAPVEPVQPVEAAQGGGAAESSRLALDGDDQGTAAGSAENGQVINGLRDGAMQSPIVFAPGPVFDAPGHHSVTDLPDLPPSLQPDYEDGDPPTRIKRKEDELDMTPMVDVTFLLLIFFMVTASFSLQKSIEMPRQHTDLPSTNPDPPEDDPEMVTVQIDEFGSFLVLATDWERETPGKQNLIRALREALGEGGGGAVRLLVEVHEDAKLRYLVDCMDAGAIAGYSEMEVNQVDGFD